MLLIGGIVMLLSGIWASLLGFKLGAVLAIPSFLVFILAAASEISTGQSVWKAIMGSWRNIMTTLLMVILVRLFMIYLGWGSAIVTTGAGNEIVFSGSLENVLFWSNVVILAAEAVITLVLYRRRDLFMALDDGGAVLRMGIAGSKTVSECPSCSEVVEAYWQSCPYCGTSLPRVCGGCGSELDEMAATCPKCGTDVVDAGSMEKTIAPSQPWCRRTRFPRRRPPGTPPGRGAAQERRCRRRGGSVSAGHQAHGVPAEADQLHGQNCQDTEELRPYRGGQRPCWTEAMAIDPSDLAAPAPCCPR